MDERLDHCEEGCGQDLARGRELVLAGEGQRAQVACRASVGQSPDEDRQAHGGRLAAEPKEWLRHQRSVRGLDISAVGVILMVVGALGLVLDLVVFAPRRRAVAVTRGTSTVAAPVRRTTVAEDQVY